MGTPEKNADEWVVIHQVGGGRFVVDLPDEEMYTKLYVAATHNRRMLPSFDKELEKISWRQPYQYYEILKCTRHLYDPEYPKKIETINTPCRHFNVGNEKLSIAEIIYKTKLN